MKRLAIILSVVISMGMGTALAGEKDGVFLRQLTARDSVLIGDRLRYGASLSSVEDGTLFSMPELKDGSDSLMVLDGWKIDTLKTKKPRKGQTTLRDLEIYIDFTSFEEGDYTIAPLKFLRKRPGQEADTLEFDAVELSVRTMPVDTTSYVPHDIRGQVKYPLTAGEVLPWLLGAILLAAFVFLLWKYISKRRSEKAGTVPDEPAHITALRKLEAFRGNRFWAPEKQKQFYSGVTDILREYISARYEFGAKEMTTAEIFDVLVKKGLPSGLYGEMKNLFETSDFVKFAKMTLPDDENAKVIPQAIRFVTETWQEVLDDEAAKASQMKQEEK